MKASDLMITEHVWACAETADVRTVAEMMAEHNVGAIPVLDQEGQLEGIITDRDLCCRVLAKGRSFETPIREVMSKSVESVHPDTDLKEIEAHMRDRKIRRLPVVDNNNKLRGFISFSDLARHCHGIQEEHELMSVLEMICAP